MLHYMYAACLVGLSFCHMQTQFNSNQYTINTFQMQKGCDGVLQNIYRMGVSQNKVLRGIIKTNRKDLMFIGPCSIVIVEE